MNSVQPAVRASRSQPGETPPPPAPLLAPTIALIGGIIAAEACGSSPDAAFQPAMLILALSVIAAAALVALRSATSAGVITLLLIGAAAAAGFVRHRSATALPPDHVAHLVSDEPLLTRVSGRVSAAPVAIPATRHNLLAPIPPRPRVRLVIAADSLLTTAPPTSLSGLLTVSVAADRPEELAPARSLRVGDRVELTGTLYAPRGRRNPGEPDWSGVLKREGIFAGLSVPAAVHLRRLPDSSNLLLLIQDALRSWARATLLDPLAGAELDEPAPGLIEAMILGQRSATLQRVDEAFQRVGASHVLSVSGFHVAILAGASWLGFRRLMGGGVRHAAAGTLLVMLAYLAIAEPNAPILRATLMASLACIVRLIGRPLAGWNWLALSAACVLLWNPQELFRAGFQLSFVQVAALIALSGFYSAARRAHRDRGGAPRRDADTWPSGIRQQLLHFLGMLLATTAIAWLAAAPLVAFHFETIAPWAILQSSVLAPVFTVVIVLGFVSLALSWAPLLGDLLALLTAQSADTAFVLVEWLGALPGSSQFMPRPPVGLVLAYYGLLLILAFEARLVWRTTRRRNTLFGSLPDLRTASTRFATLYCPTASLAAAASWWLAGARDVPDHATLTILDVGNGSGCVLTTAAGPAAVFDLGTLANVDVGRAAQSVLRAAGVRRLALAAISHENIDHFSGFAGLLATTPCERLLGSVYLPVALASDAGLRRLAEALGAALPPVRTAAPGDRGVMGGVAYEVLWPPDELHGWRANDRSLVLRLELGAARVLMTGDIEAAAMAHLLAAARDGAVDLSADVLIAPHHGAAPVDGDVSADFYRAVCPRWVIASTGKQRGALVELVRNAVGPQCAVLTTRETGAIVLRVARGGGIQVQTPFRPPRSAR